MRLALRVALTTLVLLVAWTALVVYGTVQGWWRRPVAPRGDAAAFLRAAAALADSGNVGNAVFVLVEDGRVHGRHAVSVGAAVDTGTVFQVASLSKWVTAWGVLALADAGRLDLDAPVGRYLTRWTLPASEFDNSRVTARRLLSHTAGLTDGLGYAGFAPGVPLQSLEESLTRAADASPGAEGVVRVGLEPGTEWRYSGGGYTLLQLLVEEISGEPFARYMRRAVLQPLGMTRSTFDWTEVDEAHLAAFYDSAAAPATHYRFTASAAASLYTTAADLARFVQAHVPGPGGEPAGRGVLAPATVAGMWQPHAHRFGQPIWGLGAILYAPSGAGGFIVGHDGNNAPAINTAARLDPADGDAFVMLETGSPLLATRVAGEWVFWRTGEIDILAFTLALPGMLRLLTGGGCVILLAGVLAWWIARRRGRNASPSRRNARLSPKNA